MGNANCQQKKQKKKTTGYANQLESKARLAIKEAAPSKQWRRRVNTRYVVHSARCALCRPPPSSSRASIAHDEWPR